MPYIKKRTKDFEKLSRCFKGYATPPVIADKLDVSPNTVRARLENPQEFTLGELKCISQRLHIPKEEILDCIKW